MFTLNTKNYYWFLWIEYISSNKSLSDHWLTRDPGTPLLKWTLCNSPRSVYDFFFFVTHLQSSSPGVRTRRWAVDTPESAQWIVELRSQNNILVSSLNSGRMNHPFNTPSVLQWIHFYLILHRGRQIQGSFGFVVKIYLLFFPRRRTTSVESRSNMSNKCLISNPKVKINGGNDRWEFVWY